MRPLFLTLIDFDDSIEKSTSHFWQFHSVADNGLVPERTVLKRQVENKPSGDRDISPEFYIDEIQDVLFFDSAALFQLFQNVLLQFEQSSNDIAIIVSFGRVLLQEIGFLDQFLENTLNADVNEFELLWKRLCQTRFPTLCPSQNQNLQGIHVGQGNYVLFERVDVVPGKGSQSWKVLLQKSVYVFVLFQIAPQGFAQILNVILKSSLDHELFPVETDSFWESSHFVIVIFLFFSDGLFSLDSKGLFFSPDDELLLCESELVDVELVPFIELG